MELLEFLQHFGGLLPLAVGTMIIYPPLLDLLKKAVGVKIDGYAGLILLGVNIITHGLAWYFGEEQVGEWYQIAAPLLPYVATVFISVTGAPWFRDQWAKVGLKYSYPKPTHRPITPN
jgi:hypothetical protein